MADFTPGPWAVNPFNAQVDAFSGRKPLAVCQMLWPTTMRTEAETEANARLIAAAPDLLALAIAQEELAGLRFDGDPEAAIARVRVMRRAAIAKATP